MKTRESSTMSIRILGGSCAVLVLCAAAGCTEALPTTAQADIPRWTLPSQPEFSIGDDPVTEAYAFEVVRGARILASGDIAVIDGTEIRVFDAAGSHVRTLGGRGAGPGEFGIVNWIKEEGSGGILAMDSNRRRLTLFGADGELLNVIPLEDLRVAGRVYPILRLNDGSLIHRESFGQGSLMMGAQDSEPYKTQMDSVRILRLSPDAIDTLAVRSYGLAYAAASEGRMSVGTEPLSSRHYVGSGEGFIAIAPSHGSYMELVFPSGQIDSIPLEIEPVAVDQAVREKVLEAWSGEPRATVTPRDMMLERMTWPDSLPRLDLVQTASDDRIWVRHFGVADTVSTWTIYDANGPVGRLDLPSGARVLDARDGVIVLLVRDEFDVPQLEIWRAVMAGPTSRQ